MTGSIEPKSTSVEAMRPSEEAQYDLNIPGTSRLYTSSSSSISSSANLLELLPRPSSSPLDPLNWSLPRKLWHATLVCSVTGLTAAISNDAGSAQDSMNEELGISYASMNNAAGCPSVKCRQICS